MKFITIMEDEFEILIDNGVPLKDGYNFKIPLGDFEKAIKILENTYDFEIHQLQRKTDFVTVDFTKMNLKELNR